MINGRLPVEQHSHHNIFLPLALIWKAIQFLELCLRVFWPKFSFSHSRLVRFEAFSLHCLVLSDVSRILNVQNRLGFFFGVVNPHLPGTLKQRITNGRAQRVQ